jgi:glycosyltransferase involved in cell wall biosynthesis
MSEPGPRPELSIVVPVFDEEGNVEPLHAELTEVARYIDRPYEIIFVDDGSRDRTLPLLEAIRARDPQLRIVDLDSNFGEAAALSAGFAHARGAVVVTLDGDGQNDRTPSPSSWRGSHPASTS